MGLVTICVLSLAGGLDVGGDRLERVDNADAAALGEVLVGAIDAVLGDRGEVGKERWVLSVLLRRRFVLLFDGFSSTVSNWSLQASALNTSMTMPTRSENLGFVASGTGHSGTCLPSNVPPERMANAKIDRFRPAALSPVAQVRQATLAEMPDRSANCAQIAGGLLLWCHKNNLRNCTGCTTGCSVVSVEKSLSHGFHSWPPRSV